MDGLPPDLTIGTAASDTLGTARTLQRTLANPIHCTGTGLHSGTRVRLDLLPAAVGSGITFRRTDRGVDIAARFDNVGATQLCTVLCDPANPTIRVGTVEHVMAALAACGVDNAVVAVDGPEIPVLDGSAAPFVFLIDSAGLAEQDAPRRMIEVLRPVRVTEGEAFAELRPSAASGLDLAVSIEFTAAAIGRQALSLRLTDAAFRRELAVARTFALASEIESLRAAGLAQGGHLGNAIVVDGGRVLNPGGLRVPNEFVRHKMLDVVGDLALAGGLLHASFVAHRPGHALNNRLLRALMADRDAWAWTGPRPRTQSISRGSDWVPARSGWGALPLAAAAAPV